MGEVAFFYITNPSKEEAKRIAKHLLDKRIISSANIFPIESMYWWEGKITEESEHVLIAKTSDVNSRALENEVKNMHPYKVPCIIRLPASSNDMFSEWLKGEVKK
ncbi:MAG: divalent-cation tolerance protein CutA [Candidatus Altiarchaeia archaeon]|jgi:periplasmic divalent cation tolerance protein